MALLQKGTHTVTASETQIIEEENRTPYVSIRFTDANGNVITARKYLSEAAFEYTVKTLSDAFGFDGNFDTLEGQVDGKECSIVIEDREYNGKISPEVRFINSLIYKGTPASATFRSQLSAKARLALKTGTSPRPAAKPANKPAPASSAPDDDCPF